MLANVNDLVDIVKYLGEIDRANEPCRVALHCTLVLSQQLFADLGLAFGADELLV
jgi:hypothetical protein